MAIRPTDIQGSIWQAVQTAPLNQRAQEAQRGRREILRVVDERDAQPPPQRAHDRGTVRAQLGLRNRGQRPVLEAHGRAELVDADHIAVRTHWLASG